MVDANMIQPEIRCIALDAAGTIIEPVPGVVEAYQAAAAQVGVSITRELIAERFPAAMNQHFPLAWNNEEARTDESRQLTAWESLVADVLREIPTPRRRDVFEGLWNHFSRPEHWCLFDDVQPTLERLKEHGYMIVVASNFDRRLYDVASGHSVLSHVDRWFTSADIGYQKPCSAFFWGIEKELGLAGSEIAMIGDSLVADYQGAISAGWQALYLKRDRQNFSDSTHQTRTIHSLTDTLAALGRA